MSNEERAAACQTPEDRIALLNELFGFDVVERYPHRDDLAWLGAISLIVMGSDLASVGEFLADSRRVVSRYTGIPFSENTKRLLRFDGSEIDKQLAGRSYPIGDRDNFIKSATIAARIPMKTPHPAGLPPSSLVAGMEKPDNRMMQEYYITEVSYTPTYHIKPDPTPGQCGSGHPDYPELTCQNISCFGDYHTAIIDRINGELVRPQIIHWGEGAEEHSQTAPGIVIVPIQSGPYWRQKVAKARVFMLENTKMTATEAMEIESMSGERLLKRMVMAGYVYIGGHWGMMG